MEKQKNESPQTIDELKQQLLKESVESSANEELSKIWYSFNKKSNESYVLQKNWSYLRPWMTHNSQSLNIVFDDLAKLVELATLIEEDVKNLKEDLDLYEKGSLLGTAMNMMWWISEVDIYNKDKFLSFDALNPDSKRLSFDKVAELLGYKTIETEDSVRYIKDSISKIIAFMTTIKIDEKAYEEKEAIAKKAKEDRLVLKNALVQQ